MGKELRTRRGIVRSRYDRTQSDIEIRSRTFLVVPSCREGWSSLEGRQYARQQMNWNISPLDLLRQHKGVFSLFQVSNRSLLNGNRRIHGTSLLPSHPFDEVLHLQSAKSWSASFSCA